MQTEHIHSLNLLYITLKLIVVLLEHQVDMISIFQRLTELGLSIEFEAKPFGQHPLD